MPIRSLLIWGVIALVLVVLFAAMNGGNNNLRGATELPYSALMDRVEQGGIQSVTTQNDMLIAAAKDGKSHYVTYLPQGTMANVVERLDAAGVVKRAARNNPEKAVPRKERKARAEAAAKA